RADEPDLGKRGTRKKLRWCQGRQPQPRTQDQGPRTKEMFDSLTAGAERALTRAAELARRRGAAPVQPPDLLAALTLEAESRAMEFLIQFGAEISGLRAALGLDAEASLREADGTGREPGEESAAASARREPLPRSAALRLALSEAMMQARGLDRTRDV